MSEEEISLNGGANILFERGKYCDWSGGYYERKKKNNVIEGNVLEQRRKYCERKRGVTVNGGGKLWMGETF